MRNPQTGFRLTSAHERNFTGATLKAFLTRIRQLNPSIEFDADYLALIEGDSTLFVSAPIRPREPYRKWKHI